MTTNKNTIGCLDKMDKRTQVRTLVLDRANFAWMKAHLALYYTNAVANEDWLWVDLLTNANKAIDGNDTERLEFILERMKKEVEWNYADDVYITRNK